MKGRVFGLSLHEKSGSVLRIGRGGLERTQKVLGVVVTTGGYAQPYLVTFTQNLSLRFFYMLLNLVSNIHKYLPIKPWLRGFPTSGLAH